MKTSSAKAKGRRGQHALRDAVLKAIPTLSPDDFRSTPMGVTGPDITMSLHAQKVFPYSPEIKVRESLNIWETFAQAEANAGKLTPLVVVGRNRTRYWAAVPMEDFVALVARAGFGRNEGASDGNPGSGTVST